MTNILRYDASHEAELIAVLDQEPDWETFTCASAIDGFRRALLHGPTYVCRDGGEICGYLRAMNDPFGIYVSELYVAPAFRNRGHARRLLETIKRDYADKPVYVLSDEDPYYEKLGHQRVGSIFQL